MSVTRYASLAWPWVGLLLCLALLGQEYLLLALGPNPPLTVYRLVVMAVGLTSLALVLLPPRRIAYVLAFFVCGGLIAYSLYLQYIDGLNPCPLCIFQRVCVIGMGLIFLVGVFHNPGRTGAAVYAVLQLVIGGAGIALAARQVWLQSLPKDQVPACGMGLSYMMETLPLTDVVKKVFQGSGECAEKGWEFLHLSIAGWTLVFFIAMIVAAFAVIRRD
ncbi:MAG TPA: disulfide bond formation protein B [Casimicrobiaceae bacterium]|nr:disulfide bond formation protein B [Casimicrobiaceae bacterium]